MKNFFLRSPSPSYSTASSPARSFPPLSPIRQTFSESLMNENVENAQIIIEKWKRNSDDDKSSASSVYHHTVSLFPMGKSREEAKQYIKAVHDLQTAMKYFVSVKYGSDTVVRAQKLMQLAMKQLEKEFYYVLKSSRGRLDPETVSLRVTRSGGASVSDFEGDSVSDFEGDSDEEPVSVTTVGETESGFLANDMMMDLKMIADCMISSGYTKDCVKIYKLVRKSIVDEGLYNLGVERLSFSQVQKMDWDILEKKIKTWLNASKIAVKSVFYGERLLADHVFSASASIAESCFAEVTGEGAKSMFSFPEYIAKSKRTPEQIFRTLDVYETVSELWPEIDFVFSFDSTSDVRSQTVNSLVSLGESVRTMLSDFEAAIQKDASKTPIAGGGIHPLTRYVMNYISFLTDYRDSYVDIVADWPLTVPSPLPESYIGSPEADGNGIHSSSASVRLAWLVLVLLCKLDSRAQLYNDVAFSYLFLANNLQYVVAKARSSNLSYFLGEDWVVKHEAKVRQYVANYERIGWGKVIASLPENPTGEIPIDKVKDYFRKFNASFDEVYKKHSSIVVPDRKMRDEIKTSIARKLLPSYREFYSKYRVELRRKYWVDQLVRFGPEDLENYLSDLFYGIGSGSSHSSIPSSPARPTRWFNH